MKYTSIIHGLRIKCIQRLSQRNPLTNVTAVQRTRETGKKGRPQKCLRIKFVFFIETVLPTSVTIAMERDPYLLLLISFSCFLTHRYPVLYDPTESSEQKRRDIFIFLFKITLAPLLFRCNRVGEGPGTGAEDKASP